MKRFFPIFLCLCLLLTGCSTTLMGNEKEIPYETFDTKPIQEDTSQMILYKQAMDALSAAQYAKALELFTRLGNFRDAAAYAARFTYIKDTLLRTEQYVDGVLTITNEISYDQEGNILGSAGDGGILISSQKYDDGAPMEETWQYPDYMLTKRYNSFMGVTTLSREEKRPFFRNSSMEGVLEGYNINYLHNADGLLITDQGEVSQHTQKAGSVRIEKMLFNGAYTYDKEGKLIRYDRDYNWGGSGRSWIVYEYDEHGRLIREESCKEGTIFYGDGLLVRPNKLQTGVKEYRYDEDGNMIFFSQLTTTAERTANNYSNPENPSYTYEDPVTYYIQTEYDYLNGRLMQETTTFGDTSDTIIELCYIYGDYLGYLVDEEATDNGS